MEKLSEEFKNELIKSCLDPIFIAGFIMGIIFCIFIFFLGGYL
jgi:hypothetical protein